MTNLNEKRFEHWEQQKEFRDEMASDIKKLTADMIKLQNNLQIHTENYNQYIRRIIEIDKKHSDFVERFEEYMKQSAPVFDWFRNMTTTKKVIGYQISAVVGFVAFIGVLVGVIIAIKQLLK